MRNGLNESIKVTERSNYEEGDGGRAHVVKDVDLILNPNRAKATS